MKKEEEYNSYNWKTKTALIRDLIRFRERAIYWRSMLKQTRIDFEDRENEFKIKIFNLEGLTKLQRNEIKEITTKLYYPQKPKQEPKITNKTYLIKDKNNGLYKIGYSNNPKKREKTLQSEKPNILMVKVWEENIERKLHNRYKDVRIRGEWFQLNSIQVKYICTHF